MCVLCASIIDPCVSGRGVGRIKVCPYVVCLIVQGFVLFTFRFVLSHLQLLVAYARRRFRLRLVAAVVGANRASHVGTREAMSPMRTMGVNGLGF